MLNLLYPSHQETVNPRFVHKSVIADLGETNLFLVGANQYYGITKPKSETKSVETKVFFLIIPATSSTESNNNNLSDSYQKKNNNFMFIDDAVQSVQYVQSK